MVFEKMLDNSFITFLRVKALLIIEQFNPYAELCYLKLWIDLS